jgi:hypothetical protein
MNATPKQNHSDLKELGDQVGGDNAAAFASFVDGRIAAALEGLREEIRNLTLRQEVNVKMAKEEGSSEAAKSANISTKAVKVADEAVKTAAKDPSSLEKEQAAKDKVKKAAQAVDETESELAAIVERHEVILAPWQEGETWGTRPESRLDDIERHLVSVGGEVDRINSASAEAIAIARSVAGGRGSALWLVGLVTFVVAWALAALVAAFSSVTWVDAIWIAVITTAFVVICSAILDRVAPAVAEGFARGRAEARARRAHHQQEEHDEEIISGMHYPDGDDHGHSGARAQASASSRAW